MIVALVQGWFPARISREFSWISIGGIMRRCRRRIISQVRTFLCFYCTNSGFTVSNSSIPCLLVDMILALVQRLFRARISRQCAWISIGITMRRRRRRITSQIRKGLCVYCTNSWFTFSNSSFPGLLELSAVSLTSQMDYVRSIDLQSNIIHGSVCSLN